MSGNEDHDDRPARDDTSGDPKARVLETASELLIHAELAAVFEATRKFEAQILPLSPETARQIQQAMGWMEKLKTQGVPLLNPAGHDHAQEFFQTLTALSSNDYHLYRRPGEVVILRRLEGEQVHAFVSRLQAHFDAAIAGRREDDRQALEWQGDPATIAYLDALDELSIDVAARYLYTVLPRFPAAMVLSTMLIDELNILYLAETIMGATAAELVGEQLAPGEGEHSSDADKAWYFKLFHLRGTPSAGTTPASCFFAYLQKAEDTFSLD